MRTYSGESFNLMYLSVLRDALASSAPYRETRVGLAADFGPGVFEINGDMPRLVSLSERFVNPYLAVVEAALMLAGSNSLAPLTYFAPVYGSYSDDGEKLHGAYGHRLRAYFGFDQIEAAIRLLSMDQSSRRAFLTLASPCDVQTESLNIPCNVMVLLIIRDGRLDLTTINRSNDIFWGLTYNIFVFRCLQRFLARRMSVECGIQRHFSNAMHLYNRDLGAVRRIVDANTADDVIERDRRFEELTIHDKVASDAVAIASLRFVDVGDLELRRFLDGFRYAWRHRNGSAFVASLPDNLLGYLGYHWARARHRLLDGAERFAR